MHRVLMAIVLAIAAGIVPLAGGRVPFALAADGPAILDWGLNSTGQLGIGTASGPSTCTTPLNPGTLVGACATTPQQVNSLDGVTISALAAGSGFYLALTPGGSIYSWGVNTAGELGTGDSSQTQPCNPSPITDVDTCSPLLLQVALPAGESAVAVAAGLQHALALTADAKIFAWGDDHDGQLGTATGGVSTCNPPVGICNATPEPVSFPSGETPIAIAAGGFNSLALASDRTVWSWGTTNTAAPVQVTFPAGEIPTALADGSNNGLALTSDGKVWTWTNGTTVAAQVDLGGEVGVAMSAGSDNLVLTAGGKILAWPNDDSTPPAPMPLPAGEVPVAVSAGQGNFLALAADGKLFAWGDNDFGEFANGANGPGGGPVQVPLAQNEVVKELATGGASDLVRVVVDTAPPRPAVGGVVQPDGSISLATDGQNGWYVHSPVPVSVRATDALTGGNVITGISCTLDGNSVPVQNPIGIGSSDNASGTVPVSSDGIHTLSCTATDFAGNTSDPTVATAHATVKIDTTPPVVSPDPALDSCTAPENSSGWCRGTQTAGFVVVDATSGVTSPCTATAGADCTFTQATANNGASVGIPSGQACDAAGNCGGGISAGPYKLDSAAPQVVNTTNSCSITENGSGWCRGTETATFGATDALSGVGSPCTAAANSQCTFTQATSTNGSGLTIASGGVTDVAGNTNPGVDAGPFNIDSVAPSVTCTSPSPVFNHGESGATVTASVSDPAPGSGPVSGTVNAAADTSKIGTFSVSLTGTDIAGNSTTIACPYQVQRATTLVFVNPPVVLYQGSLPTLTANLTDSFDQTPIAGVSITLSVGGSGTSCSAITDMNGAASCTAPVGAAPLGSDSLSASFAGDTNDAAASTTAPVLIKTTTKLIYDGSVAADFADASTVSATLLDYAANPVSGENVTFTLNGKDTCSSMTDANGDASCSLTPSEAAGSYTLAASFAGDTTHDPSSASIRFTVTKEETTTTYTGPTVIANGGGTTLSATLKEDGSTPIQGRPVVLTLGPQSCTGTTNAGGAASCAVAVSQTLGPEPLGASFAGDGYYLASADTSKSAMVFAWPSSGAFVLGDKTVAGASLTTTLTFWSSSWSSLNLLSSGPTPKGFKGFANRISPTPAACGDTWTTNSGNSPPPPSTVPSYMGVLVASSVTTSKVSGITNYAGNVVKIVVVKTNAGYSTGPGHTGTGTLATLTAFCP